MRITKALRSRLVEKHGLTADASDDQVKALTLSKIGDGSMEMDEVATLTKEDDSEKSEIIHKALGRLAQIYGGGTSVPDPVSGAPKEHGLESLSGIIAATQRGDVGHARVNKATEKAGFATTKGASVWPDHPFRKKSFGQDGKIGGGVMDEANRPGAPMYYIERFGPDNSADPEMGARKVFLDKPSPAEFAKMGAILKYRILRDCGSEVIRLSKGRLAMTDLDRELVQEALEEDDWVGDYQGMQWDSPNKLTKDRQQMFLTKAVLEATGDGSGGEQAVPQYFDFEAIRTPLLYGELLPWVEVVPTDRGKAAHSYSIGTPTFVTTTEGNAITPFSTTGFVSTYDANFFPATCAFEWGRDFEADSAPNFGELVMAQIGDQFKLQIDSWIATGDGTTQPQGIFTATPGATITFSGANSSTAMTYNDYLNLVFGVTKPFRKNFGGDSTRFVMNDTSYKFAMQVKTGVTGDTRPIFGMALKDYRLGDYGVSVQNGIANGSLAFCNLRAYRLYQRKGLYFDLVTTGRTLALSQTKLLVARARYGGKIVLNGYLAVMTGAQQH